MIEKRAIIYIALIHNNNSQRNAYIRPRLAELQTNLSGRFTCRLQEVAYQSQIRPHGLLMAMLRDIAYQAIERDWLRYRQLKPISLPRHIASFIRNCLKTKRYSAKSGWPRGSAIEVAVTDKHLRAWSLFLDTEADFLICLEDDVVFKEDSTRRLASLLERPHTGSSDRRIYMDLAGGYSLEALQVHNLQSGQDNSFRTYSKPITNTACGYLLSRPLAANFHEALSRNPSLRLIGVDWLMNKLFMEMEKDGMNCDCLHAEPTIFKHGSTTGEYVPWIR